MFLNEIGNLDISTLVPSKDIKNLHRILAFREITDDTFVVRLERKSLEFKAGQHIQLRIPGAGAYRVYSIYSSISQYNYLEILVKEISEGYLTPKLKRVKVNDFLELKNPSGNYILHKGEINTKKYLFLASGTGISPFHSFVLSHPGIDYKIIHGVRYSNEAYDKNIYDKNRIIICTTGDQKSHYFGRLTKYLIDHDLDTEMLVYLCGNSHMILDSMEILKTKGFKAEQFFVETYF